ETHRFDSKCSEQTMTLTFDLNGKPFDYVANKEARLQVLKKSSNIFEQPRRNTRHS
ncbi:MAG: hypothetical protein ACI8SE_001060, partial [Bacteroidia bacterium]